MPALRVGKVGKLPQSDVGRRHGGGTVIGPFDKVWWQELYYCMYEYSDAHTIYSRKSLTTQALANGRNLQTDLTSWICKGKEKKLYFCSPRGQAPE